MGATDRGRDVPSVRALGRYELLTVLGTGGMAEVHLARQRGIKRFRKLVVVKTVHPQLARDQRFVDLLLEEARISALIKHPRVVDIYDVGEEEGVYFIAMEYLPGQSLAEVIKTGRSSEMIDVWSAARIVADAAEGLAAAHDLRSLTGEKLELVHRDVSPGNIVVLYSGEVKLVDFGVAKARGHLAHKKIGKFAGKLGYAAPEQLESEAADCRSDIFSLGVVFWELLCHRRLFNARNRKQALKMVKAGNAPLPTRFRRETPAGLDAICMRALEPDPDRRFQSAREMLNALEAALRRADFRRHSIARYMDSMFEQQRLETEMLVKRVAENTSQIPLGELEDDDEDAATQIDPSLPGKIHFAANLESEEEATIATEIIEGTAELEALIVEDETGMTAIDGSRRRGDSAKEAEPAAEDPKASEEGAAAKGAAADESEEAEGEADDRAADDRDGKDGKDGKDAKDSEAEAGEGDTEIEESGQAAAEADADADTEAEDAPDEADTEAQPAGEVAAAEALEIEPLGKRLFQRPIALAATAVFGIVGLVLVVEVAKSGATYSEIEGSQEADATAGPLVGSDLTAGKTTPPEDDGAQARWRGETPTADAAVEPAGADAGIDESETEPATNPDAAAAPEPPPPPEPDPEPEPERGSRSRAPSSRARPEPARRPPVKRRDRETRRPAPHPPDKQAARRHYQDAMRAFSRGQLDEAEKGFRAALAAQSGFASAHRALGFVYIRRNDRRRAILHFKRYLRMAPKARDADVIRERIEELGG